VFQGQPTPVPDLDGVSAAPLGEEAQDVALEKRGVHAELEGNGPPDAGLEAVDEVAQEGDGLLRVMDVPRTILEAEDVAGLGQMREERVVAQVLPMMRIEAAEGPLHGGSRGHDGPIDVDGQAGQLEFRDGLDHEITIEVDQGRQGGAGELLEPVADGVGRRHAGHATEAGEERVAGEIAQVFKAPGADVEQRHHQQRQPSPTVVARHSGHRATQTRHHVEPVQVAAHQLKATVRREILLYELDRQITLDHSPQAPYAQAHQRGLQCEGSDIGVFSLSIAQEAPLIHIDRNFTSQLFSDQG